MQVQVIMKSFPWRTKSILFQCISVQVMHVNIWLADFSSFVQWGSSLSQSSQTVSLPEIVLATYLKTLNTVVYKAANGIFSI